MRKLIMLLFILSACRAKKPPININDTVAKYYDKGYEVGRYDKHLDSLKTK